MNGFPGALSLKEVPIVGNTVLRVFAIQIKSDMGLSLSLSCWLHGRCGKNRTAAQGATGVSVVVFPRLDGTTQSDTSGQPGRLIKQAHQPSHVRFPWPLTICLYFHISFSEKDFILSATLLGTPSVMSC